MNMRKRDDGMFDLLDADGTVLAIGLEAAIRELLGDPFRVHLLESNTSVSLSDREIGRGN